MNKPAGWSSHEWGREINVMGPLAFLVLPPAAAVTMILSLGSIALLIMAACALFIASPVIGAFVLWHNVKHENTPIITPVYEPMPFAGYDREPDWMEEAERMIEEAITREEERDAEDLRLQREAAALWAAA